MARITDVVIPSLVLRVQGDVAIKPRFEWLDGVDITISEGITTLTTRLRVHNDNDVPLRMPEPNITASNEMVVNAALAVADVPANSALDFDFTITLAASKTHGQTVTISFGAVEAETLESSSDDAGGTA